MVMIMKIKVWCRWMKWNENSRRTKMGKLGLSPERCRQRRGLFVILFASVGLLHTEIGV